MPDTTEEVLPMPKGVISGVSLAMYLEQTHPDWSFSWEVEDKASWLEITSGETTIHVGPGEQEADRLPVEGLSIHEVLETSKKGKHRKATAEKKVKFSEVKDDQAPGHDIVKFIEKAMSKLS